MPFALWLQGTLNSLLIGCLLKYLIATFAVTSSQLANWKDVCDLNAQTTIEDDGSVLQWCETLHVKYSDLLGTQKYHDILIACLNDQYVHVVTKVRESCCSSGSFSRSPLKLNNASATITKQQCFVICPQRKLRTWSSCTASLFHQTNNILTIFPLLFHLWWSTQQAEGHLLVLPVLAPLLYLLRQSDYVNKVHLQLLAEMQLAIRALHTEIGDISPCSA